MGNLIRFGRREVPVHTIESPFMALQQEVNRLFDSFWGDLPADPFRLLESPIRGFSPRVDVTETEKDLHVSAELPGMTEKDVELTLTGDALTIKGEKKEEKKEEKEGYTHCERYYGSFHRIIPLPVEVMQDKVSATFKDGILTIALPKAEAAKTPVRKIEVKKAA
ncbi:MAG: Hsp20/alpha crystallin family protein [Nitrospirota bacterium]|nr:Hsp20/alpha crystallin family protein [Nitrospirota bacterium]